VTFWLGVLSTLVILLVVRQLRAPGATVIYDHLPTNVFAVLSLTYCSNTDEITHVQPIAARIWYNVSMMRWEAGCPECGARAFGISPEQAASKWNGAHA